MPAAKVSSLSWSNGISILPVSSSSHFSHPSLCWANTAVSTAFAELETSTPLEEWRGGRRWNGEKGRKKSRKEGKENEQGKKWGKKGRKGSRKNRVKMPPVAESGL